MNHSYLDTYKSTTGKLHAADKGGDNTLCGLFVRADGWEFVKRGFESVYQNDTCRSCAYTARVYARAERTPQTAMTEPAAKHDYLIGVHGWGDVDDLFMAVDCDDVDAALAAFDKEIDYHGAYNTLHDEDTIYVYEFKRVATYKREGWVKVE